jgi:transitional endoplasmic reticulum ATPase
MPPRPTLRFVPADPEAFYDRYLIAQEDQPKLTLSGLLHEHPALALQPVEPALLDLSLRSLNIKVGKPGPDGPMYLPPGVNMADFVAAVGSADGRVDPVEPAGTDRPDVAVTGGDGEDGQKWAGSDPDGHPAKLTDREAVLVAHAAEIDQAASYLDGGLSVLIKCEKLLVEHLAVEIGARSGRVARRVQVTSPGGGSDPAMGGGRRADLMTALQQTLAESESGDVIVVPHLDLLAGGTDATLSGEARELTDLLYEASQRIILAFTDPSLVIPEVLANRFAIRLPMNILPRTTRGRDGRAAPIPIGRALVTADEAALFDGFDDVVLYKHIAGMNAVRLRHGLRFAYHQHTTGDNPERPAFADLLQELRVFKARTSTAFEVPNVPLTDIGGYDEVKAELQRALKIVSGAAAEEHRLSEQERRELVPRGFIFHGPPGTGKTLFAKAIASQLDATILVVSGPEITDMYVGESERKLRDLFAEARRNAPAVLVFDEFDSIAGKRTGRDDGGSRAGNAIVAQLLTELDGFRPEVPVLIIGTTNRIDIIDDALLRPSRFRPIKIDLPDEQARRAIAAVHAKRFHIEHTPALLDAIAAATEGMNGDEIRSIFRDARADELVGAHQRPDARRLGQLIGALRITQQQREIEKAQQFGRRPSGQGGSSFTVVAGNRPVAATLRQEPADGPGEAAGSGVEDVEEEGPDS